MTWWLRTMHGSVAAACVIGASTALDARQGTATAAGGAIAPSSTAQVDTNNEPGRVTDPAAEDEMVTDRPDFTESSEVIPRGGFQFESGFNYEGDTRDGIHKGSVTVPGALLRIGLGGRAELRIGGGGFLSEAAEGLRISGYSDLELGVKIRLLDQAKAGVDVAVIEMISLPFGAAGFTSGHLDPTLKVTWARRLPMGWAATGNVNFASISDDAGRFTQRAISASFGHDLPSGWGGFVELYGFTPMEGAERTGVTLDWGVARPVGRGLQFDIELGRGFTAPAPDWFVGFGFAVRGRLTAPRSP
jgi:hypothetical protein